MPLTVFFQQKNKPMSVPQNIIITGANRGIGKALAQIYAHTGVTLGLCARNQSKLDEIAEICRQQGATVITAAIDVKNTKVLKQWLLEFDIKNPIDLVIANAGITNSLHANGEPETWEETCEILDINLYGVLNTLYPLIKPMQQRQQGQMVIISSLTAYRGMPLTPSYSASKAAIKSYGEALRGWLKNDNIQVTVVCPGFVKSDLSAAFPGPKLFMISPEKAAKLIQRGLSKNKAIISFPFPLDLGMKLLALLPASIAEWILSALNYGDNRKK